MSDHYITAVMVLCGAVLLAVSIRAGLQVSKRVPTELHKLGRQVSPELEALAQAGNGGHVVTSIPSRDEAILDGHVGGTEAELPPFLAARRRGDQDQRGRADGHPPIGLS